MTREYRRPIYQNNFEFQLLFLIINYKFIKKCVNNKANKFKIIGLVTNINFENELNSFLCEMEMIDQNSMTTFYKSQSRQTYKIKKFNKAIHETNKQIHANI